MDTEGVSLPGLINLIQTAGNGAVVLLALYLLWAGKAYLQALRDIAAELKAGREQNSRDHEAIRLAIVERDPEKAQFFSRRAEG